MKPVRAEQLNEENITVIVTLHDTGEEQVLTTRGGSYNHFFQSFMVGEDEIQLRLDWSDLDDNGQPMLDADFIDPKTRKHRCLKGKRRGAHHTEASRNGGKLCYEWEFDGFSRIFGVQIIWRAKVLETMHMSDSYTAVVLQSTVIEWDIYRWDTTDPVNPVLVPVTSDDLVWPPTAIFERAEDGYLMDFGNGRLFKSCGSVVEAEIDMTEKNKALLPGKWQYSFPREKLNGKYIDRVKCMELTSSFSEPEVRYFIDGVEVDEFTAGLPATKIAALGEITIPAKKKIGTAIIGGLAGNKGAGQST